MKLDDLFSNASSLPSIPEVVQEIISEFDNPNIDFDDIAKKVAMDQVLTAKVLRLANSAKYGGVRTVANVNEAITRTGFLAFRTLVLAGGLTGSFKAPDGIDLKSLWVDSFDIAELSKWLGQKTDADAETAFTCGMVSRLGQLLTFVYLPVAATEIARVVDKGGNRGQLEADAWGYTSNQAGATLAARWKFPNVICDAIANQDSPLTAQPPSQYAALVNLANFLLDAKRRELPQEEIIAAFPTDIAKLAGVQASSVLDNLDQALALESGIESIFD